MPRLSDSYQPVLVSLLTSVKWAGASPPAANLYVRLLLTTDALGRFRGEPHLIFGAAAVELATRGVGVPDIETWLVELEGIGLIQRYRDPEDPNDPSVYLQITNYFEPGRKDRQSKRSKYPHPGDALSTTTSTSTLNHNHNSYAMGASRAPDGCASVPSGCVSKSKGPKRKPKATIPETWESVMDRPAYAPLRNDPEFGDAWSDWIKHCGERGKIAKAPSGIQAVRLLNQALKDPSEFIIAIGDAIGGDWKAPNTKWNTQPSSNGRNGTGTYQEPPDSPSTLAAREFLRRSKLTDAP